MEPPGKTVWVIADGYIPSWSNGPEPEMVSHESLSILNASEVDAAVELTVYYTDREPVGPYRVSVGARRVLHVRLNDLIDPEPIELGREYGVVLRSNVAVVVQHTRLDSRQAENGLFSTLAYPG